MSRLSEIEAPRRRCRNQEPHEAHLWRGLNTRGVGYYCVGRVTPWTVDPKAPAQPAVAEGER